MSTEQKVAEHYAFANMVDLIREGLTKLGKSPETITEEDLSGMDEFHIGGRKATEAFLGQLGLSGATRMLDVGCGIGGACRVAARQYGARVTGLDLTPGFIEAARALTDWLGLGDRIDFHVGSALDLPFADSSFDVATMLHAGMNIPDKPKLAAEVARVLKPGGKFGIYDVMRIGEGELVYPVPWAKTPETSALEKPEVYKAALQQAGLSVVHERNRREFAMAHFEGMIAKMKTAGGPPALGQHVLMGRMRPEMVKNMMANVHNGLIAPVEIIGQKG